MAKLISARPDSEAADSAGASAVVWHEVPSGYAGGTITVDPVDSGAVGQQLHVGMSVLDLFEDYVVEITPLEATWALMIVEHSYAQLPTLYIPYGAVASVDEDDEVVRLLCPRERLRVDYAAPRWATGGSRTREAASLHGRASRRAS